MTIEDAMKNLSHLPRSKSLSAIATETIGNRVRLLNVMTKGKGVHVAAYYWNKGGEKLNVTAIRSEDGSLIQLVCFNQQKVEHVIMVHLNALEIVFALEPNVPGQPIPEIKVEGFGARNKED